MLKLKLKHVESDDKRKFIRYLMSIQCAECLFLQPSITKKDSSGIATEIVLKQEDEVHSDSCNQKIFTPTS